MAQGRIKGSKNLKPSPLKGKAKIWNDHKCKIALDIISQFPDNLKAGFEAAAEMFQCLPHVIRQQYYAGSLKIYRLQKVHLVCSSTSKTLPNYKNNCRDKEGNFSKERFDTPKKVADLFFTTCTREFYTV